jgi:hypothetical protein
MKCRQRLNGGETESNGKRKREARPNGVYSIWRLEEW